MENLHSEIMLDILTRLPAESVLICKQVCKKWGALLHDPSFVHMHLQRQLPQFDDHELDKQSNAVSTKLGFIILSWPKKQFFYGEYDDNDEQSFKKLTKISHPPIHKDKEFVGSCNGLICFSVRQFHTQSIYDPLYICNPITREYVYLPRFNTKKPFDWGRIVCGFGYHSSTNEYKVVRIYYPPEQTSAGKVQVYTLGGIRVGQSRWRNKSEISYTIGNSVQLSPPGILANGALHWLNSSKGKIVAFDLEDEEFHLLPLPTLPPCDSPNFSLELQVFRGCLSLVHDKKVEGVDLWSLKKKKRSCGYDMKEEEYNSWNWSREFSITVLISHMVYKLFTLTKNGEVILWYGKKTLARYDPKTANLEKIGNFDDYFEHVHSHLNSFVSLEALGEDAKLLESTDQLMDLE